MPASLLLAMALAVHAAHPDLPTLDATLKSGDWNARIDAVHRLGEIGLEGRPNLRAAAEDADWQVRFTAVHWLGRLGPQAADDLAATLKGEPCRIIRVTAVHWLGSFGPSAAHILESALEDDSASARAANRYWLRKQGRFHGEPAEPSAIAAEDFNVCASAPDGGRLRRGKLNPEPIAKASREPNDENEFTIEDMERGPEGFPEGDLAAAAKLAQRPDPGPELRPLITERDAKIDVLMDMRKSRPEAEKLARPAGIPAPLEMENDASREALRVERDDLEPDLEARTILGDGEDALGRPQGPGPRSPARVEGSAEILPDAGSPPYNDPLPGLLAALRHPHDARRSRAADELGAMGKDAASAKADLRRVLKDPAPRVRAAAALALGKLHDEEAVEALKSLLKDKNQSVRYSAAEGLGRIGTPKARLAFEGWLKAEAKRTSRRTP